MSNPTPEEDAEALQKAMKGRGTDEEAIIKIISNRTNSVRQQIKEAFKKKFDKDLIDELKSELGGNFEDVVVALFESPLDYDALNLYNAMKGAGTDEDALIEIIASKPGWVLQKIKDKYKEKYKKDLEEDIKDDTSGDFQKILLKILKCERSKNNDPNKEECTKKAQELFDAGEGQWGTDESIFINILTQSSPQELAVIAKEYHRISGNTIMEGIRKEFSSDVKDLLETIIYAIISPSEYFASRINKAIKGAGTNDKVLIRVLVSRNELDMEYIRKYYKQLYKKEMVEDIRDDCSGDYQKVLVELANH